MLILQENRLDNCAVDTVHIFTLSACQNSFFNAVTFGGAKFH